MIGIALTCLYVFEKNKIRIESEKECPRDEIQKKHDHEGAYAWMRARAAKE